MNETSKDQVQPPQQPQAEKKPYASPELSKLGPVESVTKVIVSPSDPV